MKQVVKVFIGGSRAVSKLNTVIHARLDDLIKRGCTILIGDANGADKVVQTRAAELLRRVEAGRALMTHAIELLQFSLIAFTSIFVLVDPFAAVPTFLVIPR